MSFLRYHVEDSVAEILLDRPPVNALTHASMDALLDALARARDDEGVRAVVIGSAVPDRFCAGLDLAEFRACSPAEVHGLIEKIYSRLTDMQFGLGKPSIAAIAGAARGGGISLAISCDLLVADEAATFGYPELDVGLVPAIHFTHLPRIVGRYRAFDLLFTGRTFGAQEALELGLVSRVSPRGEVLAEARRLARVLAAKSPQLLRMAKTAFVQGIDSGYRQGVAGAVNLASATFEMDDAKEALAAFVEKRPPVWKKP